MTKRLCARVAAGLFLLASLGSLHAQATGKPAASDDNPTAYTALRLIGKTLGRDAMERVVEITGRDGVPQPFLWKLVLKEGTGSREVDVAGGKIEAQRPLTRPPAATTPIALADLNLDSSGAFDAVDQQARKVKLRYDSLNYTLRVSPATGKPVWSVALIDKGGSEVGSARLAAHDGTTITTEGRLASNPAAPVTRTPTPPLAATTETTPRPASAPVETLRPTPRPPAVRETTVSNTTTVRRTTSTPPRDTAAANTTTTTTVRRTVPPPTNSTTTTVTTTQEPIPVATLSDREDDEDAASRTDSPAQEGGLFTRTGRTLDKTSHTVERGFRKAGASVQRFFTGHSDLDQDSQRD